MTNPNTPTHALADAIKATRPPRDSLVPRANISRAPSSSNGTNDVLERWRSRAALGAAPIADVPDARAFYFLGTSFSTRPLALSVSR
jgi:hypothetical protein